jgi:hypothetical protein
MLCSEIVRSGQDHPGSTLRYEDDEQRQHLVRATCNNLPASNEQDCESELPVNFIFLTLKAFYHSITGVFSFPPYNI